MKKRSCYTWWEYVEKLYEKEELSHLQRIVFNELSSLSEIFLTNW
jgi:hypothetical protein